MSLKWFKQFVYMVVIDKSCVSSKELKVLKQKKSFGEFYSFRAAAISSVSSRL